MKTTIFRFAVLHVSAVTILILASCSSNSPPAPEGHGGASTREGVPGGIVVSTVTVNARVTDIDYTKRTATLMDSDGKKVPIKVGPQAVNFDQVKDGDLVKTEVTEELLVYLAAGSGSSREAAGEVVALAPKGAPPAGVVTETILVTGTIVGIDPSRRTAELRFEDGTIRVFPVRKDVDLSKRKIGEQVVFRLTQKIAVSIEKQ